MNKKFAKVLFAVILAAVLIISYPLCFAMAEEATPEGTGETAADTATYKYKVTVYAGNYGSFDENAKSCVFTVPYKGNLTIDPSALGFKVTNGRYYAKGLKLSGHDDYDADGDLDLLSAGISPYSVEVTEDISLVMSYAMVGDMVDYTINYVDAAGNTLSPSVSYYGMDGDSIVISYPYIEGFTPEPDGTEFVLDKEGTNVFNLVYSAIPVPVIIIPDTTGGGGGGTEESTEPTGTTATATTPGTTEPSGTGTQTTITDPTPPVSGPGNNGGGTQTTTIDDPKTPTSSANNGKTSLSTGAKIGIGAAVIGLLALILGLVLTRKKRQEQ